MLTFEEFRRTYLWGNAGLGKKKGDSPKTPFDYLNRYDRNLALIDRNFILPSEIKFAVKTAYNRLDRELYKERPSHVDVTEIRLLLSKALRFIRNNRK